jgi:hypothetical protein
MTTNGKPNGHSTNGAAAGAGLIVGAGLSGVGAPTVVVELATACREYVRRAVGVSLDGTSDTLSLLDHYLSSVAPDAKEQPAALKLALHAATAYFGEVLRGAFLCHWYTPGDDPAEWEIRFRKVFLVVNPFAAISGLVLGDDGGELFRVDEAHADEMVAALEALPAVPEEEFLLPSTRFDVVQMIVEKLEARAEAAGHSDVGRVGVEVGAQPGGSCRPPAR